MRRRAFTMLAALSLTGCSEFLPALTKMATGSNLLGSVIDVAVGGAKAYFARHPNQDREASVDAAERHARQTLVTLNAAIAAAKAASDGDTEQAKSKALEAYGELRTVLDAMGILSATPPEGGAETDAPAPTPFELPTVEAIGAAL